MKPGRRHWMGFAALFTGPAIWWGTVLLIPYSLMFAHSFYTTQFPFFVADFQFGNYLQIITDSQYFLVIWRSVKIALMVSLVTFALSFPLTYFIVFKVRSPRLRMALYVATIVPLWVSYLLRAYTWKTILGTQGILNSLLIWIGVIDEPIQLFLYNQFAMVITMAYIYTPFMVMPLYASLEKIPKNLIGASKDLGVGRLRTFLRITIPLSVQGLHVGFPLTFSLSVGY